MENIIQKYGFSISEEAVESKLNEIKAKLESYNTPENLNKCLGLMDLTTLNSTDIPLKVKLLTNKVNEFKVHYPKYSTPASICVYPNLGKTVKENLKIGRVNVTVVAGVFPTSQSFLDVKLLECKLACNGGADEVDIVLALNKFLEGNFEGTALEISKIKEVVGKRHLKVILESGALASPIKIAAASFIAMEAGADFIKTSTGKMEPAATPQAAIVMCEAIKTFYKATGKKIGFKPAGGMVKSIDALLYLAIVDTILGEEWLNPEYLRLGASRLANNLLSDLEGSQVAYY